MQKHYRIPSNFRDSGYIFNGMISKRNAVDAVIFGLFGYFLASLLPLSSDMKLSGYIFLIGIFGMLGIAGIQGIPVSTCVIDAIRWMRRKQPYIFNNHSGTYSTSAADLMLSEPQMRDAIADALDAFREAITAKQPTYVEGENFEFADDPELEWLRIMEERLREEEEAEDESTKTDQAPPSMDPYVKDGLRARRKKNEEKQEAIVTQSIDVEDIFDNIPLEAFTED